MDALIQAGMDALQRDDYAQLCKRWSGSTVFRHLDEATIASVFQRCSNAAERGKGGEWPLLMQCLIYLDCGDQFVASRADVLRTTLAWAQTAIAIAPGNALAHRLAGSACYWMSEYAGAIAAYQQSEALLPQVDLQVRLFEMTSLSAGVSPQQLALNFRDEDPSNYYRAGVTLGTWQAGALDANDADYLAGMQLALYERCFDLYKHLLARPEDSPASNAEGNTFAMCCNNLSGIYNAQRRHQEALQAIQHGLQHDEFQYLRQNLRDTYLYLDMHQEAAESSLVLMQEYDLDPALFFHCAETASSYLNRVGRSEEVVEIVEAADAIFQSLSDTEQRDCLPIYAKLSVLKAPAASRLGNLQPSDLDDGLIKQAQQENPEDLGLLAAHCKLLVDKQAYADALMLYGTLLHKAEEAENMWAYRNALSMRGHLHLYFLNDPAQALQDYEALERTGYLDFYTCYYQANCHYLLKNVQATLADGQRAVEQITAAITRDDQLSVAQLHMMLANSHFDLGNYAAAIPAYEASLFHDDRDDVRENYVLAQKLAQPKKGWFSKLLS
ncbi:hypothetical protein ACCQ13_01950 [Xanthomonas sp. NCPPB 1638]|uniref:hypothetical protein n=1 Tax=Xanthomonas TaxID=338 RepID=UPI00132F23C0|nr:hypothetical protein [Xanthomonas cucurbitae]QHG85921.1 hypothetical protein EBN15_01955 [Xanthomonas cucurbitae]WDM75826.1 hypothetical protein K6982_01930 [Xanthomonas cucurbitae]